MFFRIVLVRFIGMLLPLQAAVLLSIQPALAANPDADFRLHDRLASGVPGLAEGTTNTATALRPAYGPTDAVKLSDRPIERPGVRAVATPRAGTRPITMPEDAFSSRSFAAGTERDYLTAAPGASAVAADTGSDVDLLTLLPESGTGAALAVGLGAVALAMLRMSSRGS